MDIKEIDKVDIKGTDKVDIKEIDKVDIKETDRVDIKEIDKVETIITTGNIITMNVKTHKIILEIITKEKIKKKTQFLLLVLLFLQLNQYNNKFYQEVANAGLNQVSTCSTASYR